MKLLIVYGSTEGQTRKICEFLKERTEKQGHEVELNDSTAHPVSPGDFDAAIIGSSVHYGKYQSSIEHYVQEHQKTLNEKPFEFVSVSLAIASKEPESQKELTEITDKFLAKTGWKPTIIEQVAGALRYTKYNFFKKLIMRMIARKEGGSTDTSEDHEYTDWKQVETLLDRLEAKTSTQKVKPNA